MTDPGAESRGQAQDHLIAQASKAHAAGRLDEAESLSREVLALAPGDVQAMLLLGVVLGRQERNDEALPLLEKVAAEDRSSLFARFWLTVLARRAGRLDQAIKWGMEAVQRKPDDARALNELAASYFDAGNFQAAADGFEKAARLAPQVGVIQFGLGRALQKLGRNREATEALKRADRLTPDKPAILNELIAACSSDLDTAGAVRYARKLVSATQESAAACATLARTLIEDNSTEEALVYADKALALGSMDGAVLAELGSTSQALGRMDEAKGRFQRSIELLPRQGFAYLGITQGRKLTVEDTPLLGQMEDLLKEAGLSERHQMHLHYGLGKAADDLGNYEAAMSHYDEANRLAYESKFGKARLDRTAFHESFDFVTRTFDRGFFNRHGSVGNASELPIFVVGMMRSGTTLTEQILSCHPSIGAAGEQRFWSDHRSDALLEDRRSVDPDKLHELADRYLHLLQGIAPGASRVVDKMPMNYSLLGVIHAAFPKARVIHVRRHPVDTCLSIYATPNRSRIEWANNRENIVFAYKNYLRVMEHWRAVLPPDRMLEVRYEELVSARERVTREMIDFCGLEWSEACLRPEDNERPVTTPSLWQVRQPVYRTSVERWRHYEPWLGAFRELL